MILARKTEKSFGVLVILAAMGVAIPAALAQETVFADRAAAMAAQFAKTASNGAYQAALIDARLATARSSRPESGNINGSSLSFSFTGAPVNGATSEEQAGENAAFNTANHIASEKARHTRKYGAWFGGNVTLDARRSTEARFATTFSDGLVFGADARLGPNILIGNAVGAAFDRVGVGAAASQRSRFFSDVLYGAFFTSKTSYVDVAVGMSGADFAGDYGPGTGFRRYAGRAFGNMRYSRVVKYRNMELTPYGSAALARSALGKVRESGETGLVCSSPTRDSFNLSLGMRTQAKFTTEAGAFSPYANLSVSRSMTSGYSAVLGSTTAPDLTTTVTAKKSVSANLAAAAGIDWTIGKRAVATTLYAISASMASERPRQSLSARFTLRF